MMAVNVTVIYKIRDFNLVFQFNSSPIFTNPSTVMYTNMFPTNYTVHSFDARTCFGHNQQPYSAGYTTWEYMQCITELASCKFLIIYM